jgi:transposase-like protein
MHESIFDFPAEHWQHIRTTNPIVSTFSTVRLRTAKTRVCVPHAGMLAMFFKLTKTAEKVACTEGTWRYWPKWSKT